jgi:predicted GNAT family acetyltransferase
MSDVAVADNPAEHRYEARVDGTLAGVAQYSLGEKEIVFTHTEVDDSFEGRGVGSSLARSALDDVRRRGGLAVVPQCEFIKGWIDQHPDYQDLVHEQR